MKFIVRILVKILNRLLSSEAIHEKLDYGLIIQKFAEIKINKCLEQVVIGKNSKFYEQAVVHNFQYDKNKIQIGENTHIRSELLIFLHGGQIAIGDNCYLGHNSMIWSGNNIKIGNDVLISHNCSIIDTNSHEIDYLQRAETYKNRLKYGNPKTEPNVLTEPIVIEDHVWLSFNVIVLKGVTIGKGAIIAAGSVVTKNVEPFTMVAGNPAKFVKNIPEKSFR
jgi:acetyltransferase-like isoleucine patch superfamily enzyme